MLNFLTRFGLSAALLLLAYLPANGQNSKRHINGIMPVDVYLNMEGRGFLTKKNLLGAEEGNLWINEKNQAGIDYRVETYSHSPNDIENIRATAMVDPVAKKIVATVPFFEYVASLPYDKSEPQKAAAWIRNNINKNKATTLIGGVRFTIMVPSKWYRMLIMEAE